MTATRKLLFSILDPLGSTESCPSEGYGFVFCQATELSDAILEGYPKSKKQFFVSGSLLFLFPWGHHPGRSHSLIHIPQEEVGIETDEDNNVKLPDP